MPSDRRRERLDRITAVATRLFQSGGYESTSVNDVAIALEMSVGGLYRYITTKSDLLDLVCEDIYGDLPINLAAIEASDAPSEEKLDALLDSYLRTCAHNRHLILLMYREYRHLPAASQARFKEREQAIVAIFASVLRDCMSAGTVRSVDADLLALDIVVAGHLPALKGWALRTTGLADAEAAKAQKLLITSLLSPP